MQSGNSAHRSISGIGMLYLSIVLAAAGRLYRLGSQSIWGDEALTLLRYTDAVSLADIWRQIWQFAFHPPLYFLTVYPWFKLGTSEFMLRFPSAVFGVAAIPVLYALTGRFFGRSAAGIAALLAALSPIHIWYSQEARMYSLQILLALASTLFLVKTLQEGRARNVFLYLLFTAMGLFTHINTVFLLATQGLFGTFTLVRNRKRLALFVGIQAGVLAAFAPWALNIVQNKLSAGGGGAVGFQRASSLWDVGYGFYTFSVGYSLGPSVAALHRASLSRVIESHWPAIGLTAMVFGTLTIAGFVQAWRTNRWGFWFLLAFLLTPTALAWGISLLPDMPLNPRYMLVATVPYWIAVALGIRACLGGWALRVFPAAAAVITCLSLYNHYFQPAYFKQDMRSATNLVNRKAVPGDVIIISSIELGGPFIYYKHRDIPYIGYPPGRGLVDPGSLSGDMAEAVRGRKRVWLILGRTWSSDPHGRIPRYFDRYYRVEERRRYPGVTVLCYHLSSTPTPGRHD